MKDLIEAANAAAAAYETAANQSRRALQIIDARYDTYYADSESLVLSPAAEFDGGIVMVIGNPSRDVTPTIIKIERDRMVAYEASAIIRSWDARK